MSDLVERLRGCSFVSKDLYVKSICKEAADEIDRLTVQTRHERTCDFDGGECSSAAKGEVMLANSGKWYACCDKHTSLAMRGKAEFRDIPADSSQCQHTETYSNGLGHTYCSNCPEHWPTSAEQEQSAP